MGYMLFLLFLLTWLNVRKIRKAVIYLARQQGYSSGMVTRILDIISAYSSERKLAREKNKELKKESKKDENDIENAS